MAHPAESLHWYARDGTPMYEVPAVKGGTRPTHLGDARKLGLVPSVTTIIKCAAAPGLEQWKVRQGILAALTLPKVEGEAEDDYLSRILQDSKEQAQKAAERGSAIHAAIQGHYEGEPAAPDLWPFVKATTGLLEGDGWIPERSFAHLMGFGGKVDLSKDGYVVDFKTKEFSDPGAKLAWDEHCIQLAAYREGLGMPKAKGLNIFVSTSVPGLAVPYKWSEEDLQRGWRMFQNLLGYWKAKNRFDSSFMKAA